jgi:hypothetical protein
LDRLAEDGHGAAVGPVVVFVSEFGNVRGSEQGFLVGWWVDRRNWCWRISRGGNRWISGGWLVDEAADMGEGRVPVLGCWISEFRGEFHGVVASCLRYADRASYRV